MGIEDIEDPYAKLAMYEAGQHQKKRRAWTDYVLWILYLIVPAIIGLGIIIGLVF